MWLARKTLAHLANKTTGQILYQVKDSDDSFNDSALNVFSSVLIFSLIIFVRSDIILFLKFTNFASFSILSKNNSFSSTAGDCR